MNIILVENANNWSGACYEIMLLAKGLIEKGHQLIIVSKSNTEVTNRFKSEGLDVFECNILNDGDIIAMFKLNKLINKFRPDIVELVNQKSYWIGTLLCRFKGIKCVINRNISNIPKRKRLFSFLINRMCDRVIAVTKSIKDDLHRELNISKNKISVIHPAIELRPYQKNNTHSNMRKEYNLSDQFIFVYIGRIEKAKGVFKLVKTFSKIYNTYPNARLMMVGNPSPKDMNKLIYIIDKLNIKDEIIFTGFRKDIINILNGCNVYIHPSPSEGLPLSILEAAATNTPIISANVGGISEFIENNVNGLLFNHNDTNELFCLMQKALYDYEYMKRLSEKAKYKVFKEMNEKRLVDEYLDFYKSLLNNENEEEIS